MNGERTGHGMLILANGEKYDGGWLKNKMHGSGWWRHTNGKVRPGEWKEDKFLKWTGPEQFEAQMKVRKNAGK